MKRLRVVKWVSSDEETLQAWEEMRIEILHEIEDGGSVADEVVDAAGDVAMLVNLHSAVQSFAPGKSRIHVD
jgi:hypothetical protein